MRRSVVAAALLLAAGSLAATELRPFSAEYEVLIDGKSQGSSRMTLTEEASGSWLHSVEAKGTAGLARLSGFGANQTSHFRLVDGRPQLLSSISRSETLIRSREVRTVFDWDAQVARWEGDLKPDQRQPTPLSPDAVNGPLLNLVLALDSGADAGTVLRYRLFDRGSADAVDYTVGPVEPISVPAGRFEAVPVRGERPAKRRVVSAWYAPDLAPTPVRMLQVETGKPTYELRLISVTPTAAR